MIAFRSHLAGVEIDVQTTGAKTTVGGYYEAFPGQRANPDVIIEVEVIDEFTKGRERGPSYPGFESFEHDPGTVGFSRFDAEGTVRVLAGQPILARFQCGPSPNSLEAVIRVAVSIALPHHGAVIMHSSAIADDRGAQVFSGISGAGKSTIAAMLDQAYPVQKLSDELLLLYRNQDRVWTIGVSPFIGSGGLAHGSESPLVAVNILEQWPSHARELLATSAAMGEVCKHVLTYARDPRSSQKVLDLLADLVTTVPFYRLRFAKDASIGEVLGITC